MPSRIYTTDSPSVPYPVGLAPLLRREHPGRHWALVLGRIYDLSRLARYTPLQQAAAWRLRDLLMVNARDARAERYVRLLVPVVACEHCGADFLQESSRRRQCSDRCRCLHMLRKHGAGVPIFRSPCAVCGAALPRLRTIYCSDGCARVVTRQRRVERERRRCAIEAEES